MQLSIRFISAVCASILLFSACGDSESTQPTLSITYDINGGTGTTPTKQVYNGTALTFNDGNGISKDGFLFAGWTTTKDNENTKVSSPYTPIANTTLYALWKISFKLTYDLNGGTGTIPDPQTYTGASSLVLNAGVGLTKTGFYFAGWTTSKNVDSTKVSSPYTPSANTTLYARWKNLFTISYDINGGTGNAPPNQTYTGTSITLNDGSGISKTGGSYFAGWTTSKDNENTKVTSPYTPSANTTLYALWKISSIIIYNLNGGTGTTPTNQTYTGTPLSLNDGKVFTKSGFYFAGWTTTKDSSNTKVNSPFAPTANTTLYALWKNPLTISFDINGATGTTPSPQTYTGTALTLSNGAGLTKASLLFGGWSTLKNDSNTKVTSPYTPTTNTTLYALWVISSTLSYDLNGGAGTTPATQTYNGTPLNLNGGAGLTKPASYFIAWTTTKNDTTTKVKSPYAPAGNTTLYALWGNAYTLSYDGNGGATVPSTQTYSGTPLVISDGTGLSREGFTFGGWTTTKDDANTKVVATSFSPTANTTLYALWNIAYKVNYDLNGGTGTLPMSKTYTGNALTISDGVSALAKTGYYFAGWSTTKDDTLTKVPPLYTPSNPTTTLYALWKVAYTLSYDINGGAGTIPAPQIYNGTALTTNSGAGLSKSGAVFDGWSTIRDNAGSKVSSPYTPTANTTLYALWKSGFTVNYDLNGGTGTIPTAQFYNGTALTLSAGTGLSKAGLAFVSWTTTKDDPSTLVSSPFLPTANTTLYANYTDRYVIPDVNFRNKLKALIPTAFVGDSLRIKHSAVTSLTTLDLSRSSISSLAGIQFFTGLTDLNCYVNNLSSIDISKNTALTSLNLIGNQLTSIDLSKNTALKNLDLGNNQLTGVDVSKNTALTYLYLSGNQLTSVDVSKNTALTYLNLSLNQLTSVDVSKNTALTELNLSRNEQLVSLEISAPYMGLKTAMFYLNPSLTAVDIRGIRNPSPGSSPSPFEGIYFGNDGYTPFPPITSLRVHENVKNHLGIQRLKTSRGSSITIEVYSAADGSTVYTKTCSNYDPNANSGAGQCLVP